MSELDERVGSLLAAGDTSRATTVVLRELGPEILRFLSGVLDRSDADEVFARWSVRLWRSLEGFEGRCRVRTWGYVLARRELGRFRKGMRKDADVCVPMTELHDIPEVLRTAPRATRLKLGRLQDELTMADRTLLMMRVDRDLAWSDIALAFAEDPDSLSQEDRKRESARLRKRFQLLKQRLARVRARPAGGAAGRRQSRLP